MRALSWDKVWHMACATASHKPEGIMRGDGKHSPLFPTCHTTMQHMMEVLVIKSLLMMVMVGSTVFLLTILSPQTACALGLVAISLGGLGAITYHKIRRTGLLHLMPQSIQTALTKT